jgi:hypothetical protein
MKPVWQRLIRFEDANGEIHLGEPITTSEDQDIGLTPLQARKVELGRDADIFSTSEDIKVTDKVLDVKKLLGPLTSSQVPVIRCIGLNYAKHSMFDRFNYQI